MVRADNINPEVEPESILEAVILIVSPLENGKVDGAEGPPLPPGMYTESETETFAVALVLP